jgi:hypothetical protein
LNNVIPEELLNPMLESFIPVQGSIGALRVILKTEWMKMK